MTHPVSTSRLRWVRVNFGGAHLIKSLVWSFVDLLLAYFLYSVLHIPAAEVARLLFVFLLFGAICDIVVGAAMTWLQARPLTVLALHLLGAFGVGAALFVKFGLTPGAPSLMLAAGLGFRFAFALYDVPQTALTSLLPRDDDEARSYVSLRTTLSAVARLLVTAINLSLAHLPAALLQGGGLVMLIVMGALITGSAASLLWAARPLLRERAPTFVGARVFVRAEGLLAVLAAFLVSTTLFATLSRLLIFSPAVADIRHLGAWLLMTFSVGSVVGPLVAAPLESAWGWGRACLLAIVTAVVAGDALVLTPSGAQSTLAALIYGVGLGATGAYLWSAASDVVRRHAARTGRRIDGLVFGLVIFTIQISIALGSLILGVLMDDWVLGGRASAWASAIINSVGGAAVLVLLLRRRTAPAAA